MTEAPKPVTAQPCDPLLIAVVLPQFHPIPENDAWWGKGFTEWTNVAKARPLFPGHHQPHLPADLGFYDLRLPQARDAQAALARRYGIGGFCYYHYWFNGRRLLEQPIDAILQSGEPDFPFCMCWANENWTRAWDGRDREVLMEQHYSDADDEEHIELLLRFFADKRYLRIDGKPLFIVYKAANLPNPQRTFDTWRKRAQGAGLGELYLAQFEAMGAGTAPDPRSIGLDASIEFTPDWRHMGGQHFATNKAKLAMALGLLPKAYSRHTVFEYELMVNRICSKASPAYPFIRCVSPGFDSSPRRPHKNAVILLNNRPELFGAWLKQALEWTQKYDATGRRVVFINAWNEWAEGNHMEPDNRYGHGFLEQTLKALQELRTSREDT